MSKESKIDSAIDRAVKKLDSKMDFDVPETSANDAISKANIDSKKYAVELIRETLHELFD